MNTSLRASDWKAFSQKVEDHIENYTVPQYGDRGKDIASEYSREHCLAQVKKYLARAGRNSRPEQDNLDLIKMAHYLQMAHDAPTND